MQDSKDSNFRKVERVLACIIMLSICTAFLYFVLEELQDQAGSQNKTEPIQTPLYEVTNVTTPVKECLEESAYGAMFNVTLSSCQVVEETEDYCFLKPKSHAQLEFEFVSYSQTNTLYAQTYIQYFWFSVPIGGAVDLCSLPGMFCPIEADTTHTIRKIVHIIGYVPWFGLDIKLRIYGDHSDGDFGCVIIPVKFV